MREQGHLGGYVVGGDDATYYPDLWRFLVREYEVSSVLDIGCGEGHALRFFRDLGCRVFGIDGVAQDDEDIFCHDYASGPFHLSRRYDLGWCCEFVEHVEERHLPNFLETFKSCRLLLLTHAFPGQPGYHHVNCRSADYWRGVLASIGYREDEMLTAMTRSLALANRSPYNHYARSGMAFVSPSD